MSEAIATAEVNEANASPKAKTPKKASAPKASKKVTFSEIPNGDSKKKIIQKLKALSATSKSTGKTIADLATKMGMEKQEVYGLLCGLSGKTGSAPRCLVATGHVKSDENPEGKGIVVFLTAKGQKTDFNELPFVKPVASKE